MPKLRTLSALEFSRTVQSRKFSLAKLKCYTVYPRPLAQEGKMIFKSISHTLWSSLQMPSSHSFTDWAQAMALSSFTTNYAGIILFEDHSVITLCTKSDFKDHKI